MCAKLLILHKCWPWFLTFVADILNVTFNSSLLQSSQHLQAVGVAFANEELHLVAGYTAAKPGIWTVSNDRSSLTHKKTSSYWQKLSRCVASMRWCKRRRFCRKYGRCSFTEVLLPFIEAKVIDKINYISHQAILSRFLFTALGLSRFVLLF